MDLIKIGIAEDQPIYTEGLEYTLGKKFKIVFTVTNGQELLQAIDTTPVDVLLVDLKMPVLGGIEATKEIKNKKPDIKIIILTMHDEEPMIISALNNGANAYLLKNSVSSEVAYAIQSVAEKDFYFTEYITSVMLKKVRNEIKPLEKTSEKNELTDRELEVLNLICHQYTNMEIAEKLYISDRTVETHRKRLIEKLHAKNTAGLIINAIRMGIINIDQIPR